jgi:hypothetical protein
METNRLNTSEIYSVEDMEAENKPQQTEAAPQEATAKSVPGRIANVVSGMFEKKELPPAPEGVYSVEDMEKDGFTSTSADPSTSEVATALGTGAARGAAEGVALMGSTVAGARLGTLAAPFAGPAAPFMPFVGGLGGFAYGLYASDAVGKLFPKAERKDAEKYYEGARTFGSGLAFSPAVMFAKVAQPGANVISKTIGAIGEFARANPGKYFTSEALINFYTGLAGGSAVALAPDSPGIRAGAEVTAGIAGSFGPGRLAITLSNTVSDAVNNAITSATGKDFPDSAKNYVQQQLLKGIKDAGEDPKEILKAIDEALAVAKAEGVATTGTVAQASASPFMTKLQSTIARFNAKFSGDTKEMGEETIKAYGEAARKLESSGDPTLLAAAAIIRKNAIAKEFQNGFDIAQTNAAEKAAKLGAKGSENRAVVGNILKTEMEDLLKIARESETQLWKKAELDMYKEAGGKLKPVKLVPSKFAGALYDVMQSSTRGQIAEDFAGIGGDLTAIGFNAKKLKQLNKIPVTEDFLQTRVVAPEDIAALGLKPKSAPEMVKLRGNLLEKAREAGAAGNMAAARRYGVLADSLLDDLDAIPGGAYNEARTFSRELNNAFTRTFAGKSSKTDRTGAEVFTPEVLVKRAFGSEADTTLMRMKDLTEAANFVDPTGVAATSVREAEQKVIRSLAAEVLNENGTVDLGKLDGFRSRNADTLKYLGMEDEFKDIASTQRALLEASDPNSLLKKRINDEKAFSSLLEVDDPTTAVSQALTDTISPVKNFKSLVDIASSPVNPAAREAARNGLLSTIYQYAYQTANKSGTFKANDFSDILFKPLSPNTPSLAQMMRSNNLLSSEEVARLKRMTNSMTKVENTLSTQAKIVDPDTVFKPQDAVEDLAVSMLGARFASAIGPGGAGSLSFASRTMNMTRKFFSGMPARQRLLLLEETVKDPALFQQMMTRAITEEESRNLTSGILRRFYSPEVFPTALDRYVDTLATEEPPPEQQAPARQGPSQSQQMLRTLPPAPPTRGMPNATPAAPPAAPAQGPKPPGPQGAAQPPSQSRQMLSALFPEDRLLQGVQ